MQAVLEITEWEVPTPNHTYLLDGNKCIAYIPSNSNKPIFFGKPIVFDLKGRKFKQLANNPFKVKKQETRIKVTGSKGSVYWVDPVEKTCTCAGFTFRGNCKHVAELDK